MPGRLGLELLGISEGQAQCRVEGEREVEVKLGLRVTVNFGDAGI